MGHSIIFRGQTWNNKVLVLHTCAEHGWRDIGASKTNIVGQQCQIAQYVNQPEHIEHPSRIFCVLQASAIQYVDLD